jgi:hypothetical protein
MPSDRNTSYDLYILDQSCYTPSRLFSGGLYPLAEKLGPISIATFNNISVISWPSCFIGGVYHENHRPAASLTNFIRNGVSSNKGVLIADIYICTTVYTSYDLYILDQSCYTPSRLFSGGLYPLAEKLGPISIPRGMFFKFIYTVVHM